MRTFCRQVTFALLLASAPMLVAQSATNPSSTPSIQFGRTTISLNSTFAAFIQSTGAVLTDLNNNPLQNNSFTLPIVTGAFDLTTAVGEVEHTGGLVINAAGTTARIENFTLDTTNPAAPVITAEIIYRDHFQGRLALFSVVPPANFALPLATPQGVIEVNGLSLFLAPQAASTISALFGTPIPAGTPIGTANVYAVTTPVN